MQTTKDWLTTFWKVLLVPTPKTFSVEAKRSFDKFFSGITWIPLILTVRQLTFVYLFDSPFNLYSIIINTVAFPIIILLWAFSINALCRIVLRRASHYEELIYITMAIFIVTEAIGVALYFIPQLVGYVYWIETTWRFLLLTVATKAIWNLSYRQSLIAVLPSTVLAAFASLLTPMLLYALGYTTSYLR